MTRQRNHTTSAWPPPSNHVSKWSSASHSKTFDANTAIILIILACAAVLAFSLHAAARLILRLLTLRRNSPSNNKPKSSATSEATSSPVVFSAETRLARAEAECAICLSEFIEGERVNVLPNCGHGFHADCVEEWIAARSSCPTCRATCRLGCPAPEEP